MKRKSLTYLLTILMSMVGANAFAYFNTSTKVQVGSLYYYLDTGNHLAEVTSMPSGNYSGDIVIPASFTYNNGSYSVTSIGRQAFYICPAMTSVTIPNSVTSIGQQAFAGCTGLTGSLEIPSSVTSIDQTALIGCGTSLTSVVVSSGNTKYDSRGNCNAIIETATNNLIFGFKNTVIPNSVTSIGAYAFYSSSTMTSVTIPNSVTNINTYAFAFCSGLTSITIPNSVTSISSGAFYNCSGLTSMVVSSGNTKYDSRNNCNAIIETASNKLIYGCNNTVIPNSVTSIGDGAFMGCSGLTSVTIGNSVTSIGVQAFQDCSGLEKVIVQDIAAWCNITFESNSSGPSSYYVTNPLYYAHHLYSDENTEITELVIPNSVTSVSKFAFLGCTGLTSVEIPNSVTSIKDYAFSGCSNLTSVTIPNSVTSIGYGAFQDCSGLTEVTVEIETPLNISSYTFSNRANATLFVPTGCLEAYQAANYWKDFKNIIENDVIQFADNAVKSICVSHWDTNNDGELCISEAAKVTTLSDYFKNNTNITSFNELQFFKGLTSIGESAFWGCSGLTSVEIPNSVTSIGWSAFVDCSGLTSITIPNSVTSIDTQAFCMCQGLTSITIPNSVTSIGPGAFRGCIGLTGCLEIPSSVTRISNDAFACCGGLTSIVVSSENPYYDSRENCNALISTTFNSLILGCKNTVIPNSVTRINDWAFAYCSDLTSITIPNSVTSIGSGVFANCNDLNSIVVSSGNAKYDSRGNCNAIIETATNKLISGCKNTVIPISVTSIYDQAFRLLTSLTSVEIPNSVTSIGVQAFADCSNLTSVTIPNSVTGIGSHVFEKCSSLTSIKVMNKEPISISSSSLENLYSQATLYVPIGSKTKYQNAQYWSNFTTIEEFYPTVTISSAGVGTYCSEYALDFTGSAVKAYIVSAFTPSTGQVILTRVYDVPEQTGLVVLADNAGDYQIPMGQGATIVSNMLVGVIDNTQLNKVDGDYTNYVLAKKNGNLGFYAVIDGSTLGAHKAYLPLLTASLANLPSSAPQLSLIFDDEGTTGITTTDNGQLMMDNVYYDLSGRRVENPAHGLYIVNGKKVFIK